MATAARIYLIEHAGDGPDALVKATTPAQALRHHARQLYRVRPASGLEVADKMIAGAKIDDATADVEQEPEAS